MGAVDFCGVERMCTLDILIAVVVSTLRLTAGEHLHWQYRIPHPGKIGTYTCMLKEAIDLAIKIMGIHLGGANIGVTFVSR
jgi:hypothetical protein